MKVLFIARKFPPSVGGMEKFAFDLSTSLSKDNDLVKITWGGSNRWLPLVLPWFFFRACFNLIKHQDIQVIHMQDALQAPVGWLLSRIFRKPYILVAHGLDITYRNSIYQAVVKPFIRRADSIISISTATQKEVNKLGIKTEKSHVIFLGTNDDYNGRVYHDKGALLKELGIENKETTLLLTTGRLVKRKGVAWFINNVLSDVLKMNEKVVYLVAGDGSEKHNINTAIKENNLENRVVMLGRVSDELRTRLYSSCDIFVMPNIKVEGDMEGFGIVAHEAAIAELPVVASNLEGIADAIRDEKNGMLVKAGDVESFNKVLLILLNNNEKRQQLGEKARKYTLEEFNWSAIARKYVKVYEEITTEGIEE